MRTLLERSWPLSPYSEHRFTWWQVGGGESDFREPLAEASGESFRDRANRFLVSPDLAVWDGAGGSPIARALPINGPLREFVPVPL